jgi:hypothetical protein
LGRLSNKSSVYSVSKFAATIFKDNLELTVPNNAKIGHVITKLGCSDFGLALQAEGNPQ